MKKIWKSISNLGTGKYSHSGDIRNMKLCNRINMLIIFTMVLSLLVLRLHGYITNHPPGIASLKILLVITSSILNLLFARLYWNSLSKILTSTVPSFIFLYFPLFFNYIEEDSFINYPYFAICSSIIPILIFSYNREKSNYLISMIYCLLSVLFVDVILILLSPDSFHLKSVIISIYPFYKISSLFTFLFLNLSILYLKILNRNAEENLKLNNLELQGAIKELNKAQNQLIQSEKMASVGILSAGVSHELNNPMNFIYSGIQSLEENYNYFSKFVDEILILAEKESSEETKVKIDKLKEQNYFLDCINLIPGLIESIKTGSERAEDIVKELRYFASFDDQGFVYIDLNETIDLSLEILKNKISDKIIIKRNYEAGLKPLKCNSGSINQLITNILTNSIEAIESEGEIIISTSLLNSEKIIDHQLFGEHIKMSIKDNGIGIAEENINKIFLPFYTTKEVGKGTGMGLAICHNIIEKHSGKIIVRSEPSKGSEFQILIPTNL